MPKLVYHRECATFSIFRFPWFEAYFTGVEIDMIQSKRDNFPVPPAGDVAEPGNRSKVRGQVAADSLKPVAFKETLPNVVFLQHWEVRDGVHLWGRRLLRQKKRMAHSFQLAIDSGVFCSFSHPPNDIGSNLIRRDLARFAVTKYGQKVQTISAFDVVDRTVAVDKIVVHDVGGQFFKFDTVCLTGNRNAAIYIRKPLSADACCVFDRKDFVFGR